MIMKDDKFKLGYWAGMGGGLLLSVLILLTWVYLFKKPVYWLIDISILVIAFIIYFIFWYKLTKSRYFEK